MMVNQPPSGDWATRLPDEHARRYGMSEAHAIFFQPVNDKAGPAPVMAFMIPETPQADIMQGLARARRMRARVLFLCDTAGQADDMAKLATAKLPKHHRVSLERAEAGGWGMSG